MPKQVKVKKSKQSNPRLLHETYFVYKNGLIER
jgi:hypothetical protein